MLIDEQFRKCVTLLSVEGTDRLSGDVGSIPVGTGFFVSVPFGGDPNRGVVYVVTALHVLYGSRPTHPLQARLNLHSDTWVESGQPRFIDIPIPTENWVEHATSDVAVAPMPNLLAAVDARWIDIGTLAGSSYIEQRGVGVGEEVFFTGLFSQHPGRQLFQPIVRFGNISMMPHEKVIVKIIPDTPVPIDAYLVEARSWGGHSGSPAFVYLAPDRNPGSLTFSSEGFIALLGLVSGHYPIPVSEHYPRDSLDSTVGSANSGIAVVVPSQAILDLLNGDELVAARTATLGGS